MADYKEMISAMREYASDCGWGSESCSGCSMSGLCCDGCGPAQIADAMERLLNKVESPEFTIGKLLPVLRYDSFSRQDEGQKVILAPECEEYTHVVMNVNSGFLDIMSQVVVTDIDADSDCVRLWVKTKEFDFPVLAGGEST